MAGSSHNSDQRPRGRHAAGQINGRHYDVANQTSPNKKKKASKVWRAVFWLALVIFAGSLVGLGYLTVSYNQGQVTYREIAKEAFIPPRDVEGLSLDDFVVDWDALLEKNPDTVGWIYIPNTVVNYPIVQADNDVVYLTTDFLGGQGSVVNFGSIFLAAENASDFSDPNNIIYGHHMNDGSMFATIDTFRNQDEFNANRTIYILTPQGNYRLASFSLVICTGDDPLAQTTFASREEMDAYLQDKIDRSVVSINSDPLTVSSIEKSFALVTCDYTIDDGRAVLFASVEESTVEGFSRSASPQDPEEKPVNPNDVANVENVIKEFD